MGLQLTALDERLAAVGVVAQVRPLTWGGKQVKNRFSVDTESNGSEVASTQAVPAVLIYQ